MCSTNPVTYYDEAPGSVDKDRAATSFTLTFTTFDAVPLNTTAAKKAWTRWLSNKVHEKELLDFQTQDSSK